MASSVIRVDDTLFGELRSLWASPEAQIDTIIKRIRERFGIEQCCGFESLVFYGVAPASARRVERVVGRLVCITPGVVILDASNNKPLTGLLERLNQATSVQLFGLRSLSSLLTSVTLYIWPHCDTTCLKNYPASISWNIGNDSYDRLGIDISRWGGVLKPWLDKCLPSE